MNNLPCNIDDVRKNGIYFHSFSNWLSHICLCLADGLNQLGIPVFSNIEAQVTSLFRLEKIEGLIPDNAALFIVDLQEDHIQCFQGSNIESSHPCILAFSMSDSVGDFYMTDGKILFCTHENKYRRIYGKRFPCAFGVSSFMIEEAEKNRTDRRQNVILRNFRPSYIQSVRQCLDMILLPHLKQYFEIDWKIGNDHFERLSSYIGCLGYGGFFLSDYAKHEMIMKEPVYRQFLEKTELLQEPVIIRWDSWRFWESLTCGCLTFHLDFDKYGFMLPVMPENWKHYIGLNLEDVKGDIERLLDERDKIPEIAENGRKWALENYSPLATAKRFLGYVTY